MLSAAQCQRLTSNDGLVVAPSHGFVWCPNAKVGTTTWYEILRRKLAPHVKTMPRCFPQACPDDAHFRGRYPLVTPVRMAGHGALCDRRRFVSFTFVRNPGSRLASAYLSKIARPRGKALKDPTALAIQVRIRGLFGLAADARISFGQFVRWVVQQNSSTMNQHWRPHADRCDTLHTPYEFIGRYETMQEDILHVVGLLGWSPSLIPATHWSSLDSGERSRLKPGNESRVLRELYTPQLVDLVARKYRDDIVPFGYTFPG